MTNYYRDEVGMNILILGGLGFLGVNITKALLEKGHLVTVVDSYFPRQIKRLDGCRYIVSDFKCLNSISTEFDNIDTVIHLISTTLPATSNDDIDKDISTNLLGTIELLRLCVERGVGRVIFSSSGGTIYGIPKTIPIPETHITDPICSYGIVKLSIEKYLQLFYRLYGLDYYILRVSNPYGPYQNYRGKQGSIGVFIWKLLHDEPIEIWGDGSVIRDYIYIEDVANAFVIAVSSEENPIKTYNIGSGKGYSINDIIKEIKSVLQKTPTIKYLPGRNIDVPVNILDVSLANTHLGWSAETSISEGIKKTAEFIKALKG